jgi:hypothetical protein
VNGAGTGKIKQHLISVSNLQFLEIEGADTVSILRNIIMYGFKEI